MSFVLPAAHLGGAGRGDAPGVMVALLAGYVLPLAMRLGSGAYALLAGTLFLLLLLQNGVMFYGLRASGRPGAAPRPLAHRLTVAAAFSPWAVFLVDYGRLYAALGLAGGDGFRLRPGFFVWASSFALLAAALWPRNGRG